MRKIEKLACQAFYAGRLFKRDNTSVQREFIDVDGVRHEVFTMRLFNNAIARRFTESGKVEVTLAGWNSPTTKSRLRALNAPIYTKQGRAHFGEELMNVYGFYPLNYTIKNHEELDNA